MYMMAVSVAVSMVSGWYYRQAPAEAVTGVSDFGAISLRPRWSSVRPASQQAARRLGSSGSGPGGSTQADRGIERVLERLALCDYMDLMRVPSAVRFDQQPATHP